MEVLARGAEGFIGLFQQGGETFVGLVTGILPTLIVLITFVNAIVKIIGEDRVQGVAKKATKNVITRYTLLPLIAVFFLTNPMCYTFGKFLDEKYKPAFYDAAVSFVHPITGLFPHANPAELFVYLGIAEGIKQLGLPLGQLAVRYFLVGLIVIFMRGVVTEFITARMLGKK
ncbi:PTS glucitol/sorbitol transporter subunit IIC [Sporanaerobacter acetigenes]|uniref:PTS system, glucitol/sorbitol-specific IIC component n=1 Tax=Sporanaerobacter acetigenes DSM 13106 TaxID=1123281 RepID=A0A1M5YQ15_9FIRM|nr:PTS glucitol/sorbitol transporter subunit IIC [Sporanaerobacter acetigenes]SHI13990.1 PTS system, glucitol/sorbitol-specific IIC component [Sporanaerobacter acetigenes DSM 13106]